MVVPAHWRDARCRVQLSEPVPGVAYQVIIIMTIKMMVMVLKMSVIHSELLLSNLRTTFRATSILDSQL